MWTGIHDNRTKETVKFPNGRDTLAIQGTIRDAERYLHEILDLEMCHHTCECCGPDFAIYGERPFGTTGGPFKSAQDVAKTFGATNCKFVNAAKLHELFPNTTPAPVAA